MEEKLLEIKKEAEGRINKVSGLKELESIRVEYLGRKSFLSSCSKQIGQLNADQKRRAGKLLNQTKNYLQQLIKDKKESMEQLFEKIDISFPAKKSPVGKKHPLSIIWEDISGIFERLGFDIEEGTEIEDEWHNFQALNIPLEHPSRDVFDTFYLNLPPHGKYRYLLRSHTSPSQIRLMKKRKPPFAFVVPGRVYRPDKADASHSSMFIQIEGFAVGRDINFARLKGVLLYFARNIFSEDVRIRLRPHFFPFTEPSAEVDISCFVCGGKGCSVCKRTGWIEVLGCGMIHPNVLKGCRINPKKYQGFAFGIGVDRIALLKYGIDDIRLFYENDKRFLDQFYEV